MARRKKTKGTKRKTGKKHWFKTLFWVFFWISVPLLVIATVYVLYLTKSISDRFYGKKWDLPSKVYSDSLVLYPEMTYPAGKFEAKLKRLGYARASREKFSKGNYKRGDNAITVYLRDFDYPREPFRGFLVKVEFDENKIRRIENLAGGEELYSIQLEPELIAEIFARKMEERKIVRLKDVPDWFPRLLVEIEDKRFYKHFGVDLKSIGRAFLANIRNLKIVQGGSTITQQLVRNFFLYQKQTLWRKSVEAVMAIILEVLCSKDEILETYMNEVWMGQKGSVSIHGFGEASRFYFGKDVRYITPLEGAMLIGMIRSAYHYSPYRAFDKSLERAKLVLQKGFEAEIFTKAEYKEALSEKPTIKEYVKWKNRAPYFTGFIKRHLLELYSENMLTSGGLRIFTTLDMDMQREAEIAIERGLNEIERDYKPTRRKEDSLKLQASIIAVKPQTGYIKAYVGGRDFTKSQFDRVSQAKRQPGSLFKPFVYLTAFELSGDSGKYTPSSILEDSEVTIEYDGRVYTPKNYDDKYFGPVTFRTALEKSLNSATVRLGHEIGEKNIVSLAKKLGIESNIKPYPSMCLGSFEVTPLEMAQAYSVIANMGIKATLLSIKDVIDNEGQVLQKKTMDLKRLVDQRYAFLLNYILKGVFERGTGKVSRYWGFEGIGAGKTGTSDDYRDSWFVGYTPELLSLAWIGFDNNESTTLTGTAGGLRIWSKFMSKFPKEWYDMDFRVPDGIEFAEIDLITGLLATRACQDVVREAYVKGTKPRERAECRQAVILK